MKGGRRCLAALSLQSPVILAGPFQSAQSWPMEWCSISLYTRRYRGSIKALSWTRVQGCRILTGLQCTGVFFFGSREMSCLKCTIRDLVR